MGRARRTGARHHRRKIEANWPEYGLRFGRRNPARGLGRRQSKGLRTMAILASLP